MRRSQPHSVRARAEKRSVSEIARTALREYLDRAA